MICNGVPAWCLQKLYLTRVGVRWFINQKMDDSEGEGGGMKGEKQMEFCNF